MDSGFFSPPQFSEPFFESQLLVRSYFNKDCAHSHLRLNISVGCDTRR